MRKSTDSGRGAQGARRIVGEGLPFGLPSDRVMTEFKHDRDLRLRVQDDRTMKPKVVVRDEV